MRKIFFYLFALIMLVFNSEIIHATDNSDAEMKGQQTNGEIITVIEEKAPFPGYIYRPNDNVPHPGILLLHGSEGGNGTFSGGSSSFNFTPLIARNYANLGFVTYALCWFDCKKNHKDYDAYPPDELKEIDLLKTTYEAFIWLKKSNHVQNKKVAIWGGSYGAQQAILLASLIGKQNNKMGLIAPDAIIAISPSDVVSIACTREQIEAVIKTNKMIISNDSLWIFDGKKIKTGAPIDIQYYKGPSLITYFSHDPISWGVPVNPENLVEKYKKNKIPYTLIRFSNKDNVSEAIKTAKENMVKNLFINFSEEKGHSFPRDPKSYSLMDEAIKTFLRTHLGN